MTSKDDTESRSTWGNGSVQNIGPNRWRLRYWVRLEGMPPQRKTATFEGTEAAAYRRIKELQRAAERTGGAESRKTLAPFIAGFLEQVAAEKSVGTTRIYSAAAQNHVTPRWGAVKLTAITEPAVRQWYTDLMTGKGRERAYSRNTLSGIHAVLRGALGLAVGARALPRSPIEGFRMPDVRVERQRRQQAARNSMSRQEAAAILAAADQVRAGSIVAFMLLTGVRIGEALALRWEDVDLETGDVLIHRTRSNGGKGGWYESEGKTKDSKRTIHTRGGPAHDLLRQQAERVDAERELRLPGWSEPEYVFFTLKGGPYSYTYARKVQQQVCELAGLPYFRPHENRHTVATLLLRAGADLAATADMLGHKRGGRTTLEMYRHALEEDRRGLAAILASQVAEVEEGKGD